MAKQPQCPQCRAPVEKSNKIGTPPRCPACREQNRVGRMARQRQARKEGRRLQHHDKMGQRYETRHRILLCTYCGERSFRHATREPVCANDSCLEKHKLVLHNRRRQRKQAELADKVTRRRTFLRQRLARVGKDLAWYDSITSCGICGATEAGGQGRWLFDHDHRCCPAGSGCTRCFRGYCAITATVGWVFSEIAHTYLRQRSVGSLSTR